MAGVTGRGTGARAATVGITNASTAVTAPAGTFDTVNDVGRSITGTGIAAGTTLTAVASATAATLSQNATATNAAAPVMLGERDTAARRLTSEQNFGFRGWSPETAAEATAYQCTSPLGGAGPGAQEPSRITSPTQGRDRRFKTVNP
jgi:hypothetical protein